MKSTMNSRKSASSHSIYQAALSCICLLIIYGCSDSSEFENIEMEIGSESIMDTASGDTLSSNDGSNIAQTDSMTDLLLGETDNQSGEGGVSPVLTSDGEASNEALTTTDLDSVTELPIDAGSPSSEIDVVAEPSPVILESSSPATIRVDFSIMVPVYMSDELQVRLNWGDINTAVAWQQGQSWATSETFPANTTNLLMVTFVDRNGAITLGSFEYNFTTGAGISETYQITADQFDTERWDSDSDGVSNLNELIAGTNPDGDAAEDDIAMDEPATVPENSVTPIDARTILPEVAEELLATIINSVNMSHFAMEVDLVNALHQDGGFGPESVSTEPGLTLRDTEGNTGTFDCANGGNYTYRVNTDGSDGGRGTFDNCSLDNVFGGVILNGDYFHSQGFVAGEIESNASTLTRFSNFTSVDASGKQRSLSGRMGFSHRTVNDSMPVIASFGETMAFVEFTSSGDTDSETTHIAGSFLLFRVLDTEDANARLDRPRTYEIFSTYSSPLTGGSEFSVRSTAPFSTIDPRSIAEDGCYVSGLLEVIAEDGSAMIMRVDNGDPASFQLDVNALSGSTSLTIPWDDRFEPMRFPVNASGEVNHAECTRG